MKTHYCCFPHAGAAAGVHSLIPHGGSGSAGNKAGGKQVIVINNGTEPVSLDPHKAEGVPESNIILNLLEGLVSTDGDGHIVPGGRELVVPG